MSKVTDGLAFAGAIMPELLGLARDLISRHNGDVDAAKAEMRRIRDYGTAWAASDERGRQELDQMRKAGG